MTSYEPTGFQHDDDHNIVDVAAQRALEAETARANRAPNDLTPLADAVGTPAQLDADSPSDYHSDGGSTLWRDEQVAEAPAEPVAEPVAEPAPAEEPAPEPTA